MFALNKEHVSRVICCYQNHINAYFVQFVFFLLFNYFDVVDLFGEKFFYLLLGTLLSTLSFNKVPETNTSAYFAIPSSNEFDIAGQEKMSFRHDFLSRKYFFFLNR